MKYEDLRQAAQAILASEPAGDFEMKTFATNSGSLKNVAGIPEHHRSEERAYPTVRGGWAYKTNVTIICRDTGMIDAKGRVIYQVPAGRVFIFNYLRGSAEDFDSGAILEPRMELNRA